MVVVCGNVRRPGDVVISPARSRFKISVKSATKSLPLGIPWEWATAFYRIDRLVALSSYKVLGRVHWYATCSVSSTDKS
jgi:hypothetical protein